MIKKSFLTLLGITLFLACKTEDNKTESIASAKTQTNNKIIKPSKADVLLTETIKAHGGDLYNTAHYSFVFRGNTYSFKNNDSEYHYTKQVKKGNSLTIDHFINGVLSKFNNNQKVALTEKEIKSATEGLNSVIYFATLPHKLNDDAVNKTYIGETSIKGKDYAILGITFNEENGGVDFDDEFYYWINQDTKKIDYLAYNYKVNKGGVRFRSAYNIRVVDGITFQDYINYKAEVGTALKELPALYEAEKLKELSKIETENIINLNKQ